MRRLFSVPADEDEATARAALDKTLDAVEPGAREAAIAVLLEVLGYEVRSPLDAQGRRRLVVSVLRATLERLAAAAPLLVLLEDLHWSDATSAAVLRDAISVVPALRCLVLSTSREAGDVPWPAEGVALDSLPREAAAQLVDRLAAVLLDEATRTAILDRTAGNPCGAMREYAVGRRLSESIRANVGGVILVSVPGKWSEAEAAASA